MIEVCPSIAGVPSVASVYPVAGVPSITGAPVDGVFAAADSLLLLLLASTLSHIWQFHSTTASSLLAPSI